MSSKNTKRPPNETESRLHRAALSDPKSILTIHNAQSLVSDAKTRIDALNWLLSVGLLKPLHDDKNKLVAFRAVSKGEIAATKDLTSDEKLVLDHIAGARNEGIWTKTLKAKTNLHQNVVDRCLKSLVQKKLVKRVPAVNNKKIYMLEGLEPSVELTGGAWYVDGELDTGLIHHLSEACLKIIREMSLPKRRSEQNGAIYPISNAPKYPNTRDILKFIKKANITQVDLTVQDIEMLLNVLVLDGEIEKLPAVGSTFWDISTIADGEDEAAQRKSKEKRKKKSGNENIRASKRRRRKNADSSDDSDSSSGVAAKSSKRKRTKAQSDSETSDSCREKQKKKRKALFVESSSSSEGNEEEYEIKSKSKRQSRRRIAVSSFDDEESSVSASDSESTYAAVRKMKKSAKRSPSPIQITPLNDLDDGTSHVYRAVKQEHMSSGWVEAPCCLCPSFEFCSDKGAVNPRQCVYYGDWLSGKGVQLKMGHYDWQE